MDYVLFYGFMNCESKYLRKIWFPLVHRSTHPRRLLPPLGIFAPKVVVIGSKRWLHLLRISWRRSVIDNGGDEVRRFALKEAKQSKDGGTRKLNPSNMKFRKQKKRLRVLFNTFVELNMMWNPLIYDARNDFD
uniref:Uncharacterized protein n=1 Tax=Cucumis melo TaxID=3656 RepID=A0A9I9E2Q6_CUCME